VIAVVFQGVFSFGNAFKYFFYFLKIIFYISTSKISKKYKILILSKKYLKFKKILFGTQFYFGLMTRVIGLTG
jgi:hypothetical protein